MLKMYAVAYKWYTLQSESFKNPNSSFFQIQTILIPHGCYRYDVALEAKELKRLVVIETVNKAEMQLFFLSHRFSAPRQHISARITRYAETGSDTASPFCSVSTLQKRFILSLPNIPADSPFIWKKDGIALLNGAGLQTSKQTCVSAHAFRHAPQRATCKTPPRSTASQRITLCTEELYRGFLQRTIIEGLIRRTPSEDSYRGTRTEDLLHRRFIVDSFRGLL